MAVAYVTNKSARTCDNTCEREPHARWQLTGLGTRTDRTRARSLGHTHQVRPPTPAGAPRRGTRIGQRCRCRNRATDDLCMDSRTHRTPAAGTIHQVGLSRGLEVGQRTVHRGGRRFGHQVGIRPASRTEVTPKKIVLQQQRAHEAERPRIRVAELRSAWALAGESCARAPRSNTRCRGMQSREGQDGHDQASCWASREGQYGDDQNP